jgi:lipopolysaccharide transport system permease protein
MHMNLSSVEDTWPRPAVVIQPTRGLFNLDLASLWEFRELVYFFVWRDFKVRYKQTIIGAAWAVLQPVLTMVIFTLIFGYFAKLPSDGVPYPVFAFTALLPWTYFAQAITRSGTSLVGDSNLIKKVYFPRLIIPLAAVVSPLLDLFVSFLVLLAMMIWYGISPTSGVVALPVFLVLALSSALGVSLWLAPLNAKYRDVGHTIPFLIQLWMYASPVVYSVKLVPEKWRLYYGLNPMVGVIEGFRWALLGTDRPAFHTITISAFAILVLLASGIVFFKRMERSFADTI